MEGKEGKEGKEQQTRSEAQAQEQPARTVERAQKLRVIREAKAQE
jgi:hypothetical protein